MKRYKILMTGMAALLAVLCMNTSAQARPKLEIVAKRGHLYGPLEPWINKSWKPGEIEMVR